ncbi:MAG: hypothetical protein GWN58_09895, partial [Anaerolineae bacterium]|nr:hypothetical protein [Anaerolineae bacterium]
LRRYDELQAIINAFNPGDSILERSDQPLPEKLAGNQEIERLLEVVDGKRTLTDLCLELHASEFRISRLAYALYRQNCLRLVNIDDGGGTGSADVVSTDDLLEQAAALLKERRFEEALGILGEAAKRRPSDPALRETLDLAEKQFVERAYQHYLPADRIPTLTRNLEDLTGEKLTSEEGFLATRINGSWTIKD